MRCFGNILYEAFFREMSCAWVKKTTLSNLGAVVSLRGSVVNIRFDVDLPPIYTLLYAMEGKIAIEVLAQLNAQRDARIVFQVSRVAQIKCLLTDHEKFEPGLSGAQALLVSSFFLLGDLRKSDIIGFLPISQNSITYQPRALLWADMSCAFSA
jgi:hypothetical protein